MVNRVRGTNGSDSLVGTDANERDVIEGFNGNDELRGKKGPDSLFGYDNNDGLYGNGGADNLYGGADADQLRGGSGDDQLYGDEGNDILFGQSGYNILKGGAGDDRLIALGESRPPVNEDFDKNSAQFVGRSIGFDSLTGGSGVDFFQLQRTADDEGRLFTKGQKFAVIEDFDPGIGDKIVLPGSADDYRAEFYGANNGGTLIYYVEEADIDVSLGFGGVSFSTDFAIDIPSQSALVAVIENAVARNMYDTSFYQYTGT